MPRKTNKINILHEHVKDIILYESCIILHLIPNDQENNANDNKQQSYQED